MGSKHVRGSQHEQLVELIDSVLDSDSEDSICEDVQVLEDDSLCENESVNSDSESDNGQNNRAGPSQPKRTDNEWEWVTGDNVAIIHPFTANSGVSEFIFDKYAGESPTELSIFLDFMDPLFSIITTETNNYARKQLSNDNRKSKSDDDKWFDTTEDEIKAYFALCILMSQVRKPRIQLYWSKSRCIETPIFSETMSRERFLLISRFLHFTDDTVTGDAGDKLKKLRPIINHFLEKFSSLFLLSENIVLDESLMKFRGRLPYVQCNRSKRARFGIKIYKICDSDTGYCNSFRIYTGDDMIEPSLPASTNVVMHMCEPLFNKGHSLYLDNWYMSPDLCKRVSEKGTNIVGTVRANRKNMPADISTIKLKRGEYQAWFCNNILCLKWKDNKDVHFLSSKHETANITTTGKLRRKRGQQPREEIEKPRLALDYQDGMKGVDLQDQVTALFPIMRRTVKGYRKIFFYLLDICIFNAFVVHCTWSEKKKRYTDFRVAAATQLLETVQLPDYKVRGRPSSITTPLRLQAKNWAHFPMRIPSTDEKKKSI